jgi:hypothetical protein
VAGLPCAANAPSDCIIACDSARRPGSLARVNENFAYRLGPKLPKTKGRSKVCAAPKIVSKGAGSASQSNR